MIKKIFRKLSSKSKIKGNLINKEPIIKLSKSLSANLHHIKQRLGNSKDLLIREYQINNINVGLLYIDGLIDKNAVHNFIMETNMLDIKIAKLDQNLEVENIDKILEAILPVSDIKELNSLNELFDFILSGGVILLFDGSAKGLVANLHGWQQRSIQEPSTESVVRGPKEGFTENLITNTSLIRRRIKSPDLWIKTKKIGKVTKTNVAIMYINGIASEKIVNEVNQRLDRIDLDGILEGGYIEELIQDEAFTPFPTIDNTERPDTVAAGLLEGRVAIIVDGTPFVLLVPALFIQYFQSAEDYYQRADISSLLRMLRFVAFFIALLGPSFYIALSTFHQEMIPTPLAINLAAQREGVPFPAFIEALIMEITFELLREAGIRMPRAIGQAVSIVGALVIGQAAVEAGLVTPAMVIVVSITAISSFIIPSFNFSIAIRMIRFGFMFLAASFGLYGIVIGIFILLLHLSNLRSFGIPYMSPLAPFIKEDQKDSIFRFPRWMMSTRPKLVNQTNIHRENLAANKPKKPDPRERDN